MEKLRYKANDVTTVNKDVDFQYGCIPKGTPVRIKYVDHIFRSYDIEVVDNPTLWCTDVLQKDLD